MRKYKQYAPKAKYQRVTDEQIDWLIRQRAAGRSVQELAEELRPGAPSGVHLVRYHTEPEYRTHVMARGYENAIEGVTPEVRELLEPTTFGERVAMFTKRLSREGTFRRRVLNKYGSSCVVCGYDLHVEAAHVVQVKHGGNEAVTNGRPACPNHHWELDNGHRTWDGLLEKETR